MDLDVQERNRGHFQLKTSNHANIFYKRESDASFQISTEKELLGKSHRTGWFFDERALRQAAELFMRLADQLVDERGQ